MQDISQNGSCIYIIETPVEVSIQDSKHGKFYVVQVGNASKGAPGLLKRMDQHYRSWHFATGEKYFSPPSTTADAYTVPKIGQHEIKGIVGIIARDKCKAKIKGEGNIEDEIEQKRKSESLGEGEREGKIESNIKSKSNTKVKIEVESEVEGKSEIKSRGKKGKSKITGEAKSEGDRERTGDGKSEGACKAKSGEDEREGEGEHTGGGEAESEGNGEDGDAINSELDDKIVESEKFVREQVGVKLRTCLIEQLLTVPFVSSWGGTSVLKKGGGFSCTELRLVSEKELNILKDWFANQWKQGNVVCLSNFVDAIAGSIRMTISNVGVKLKCEYKDTPPLSKYPPTRQVVETPYAPHLILVILGPPGPKNEDQMQRRKSVGF